GGPVFAFTITVTLTDHVAGDLLFVDAIAFAGEDITVSLYNAGTGIITFQGTGTLAEWEQALGTLKYRSTSSDPGFDLGDLQRSITFSVAGVEGTSNTATAIVNVDSVENLTLGNLAFRDRNKNGG